MKTRDAARILRTISDPEILANRIMLMGPDTYSKAVNFNKKAGIDYMQHDGVEVEEVLKKKHSRYGIIKRK